MVRKAARAAIWGALVAGAACQWARADDVDDYIRAEMLKRHIPGASVAVVRDGEVVLAKGYGLANAELAVPATEETVYQLASVTKQFTATAIMMLVEEGKLGLDDKIAGHLEGLPEAWGEVTIRQLLSHTSGIKSYTDVGGFEKTTRKDYEPREIIDLVAKEPLEFAPGKEHRYCNTGYFLLGMIIEKVAGKPYGEFLDERIFKPLGMSRTRTNDLRAIIPGRAQGYEWDGKQLRNGEYVSPTQPYAAGMLVSCIADMLKWDAALSSAKVLKPEVLEQMWAPAPLSGGDRADYGFGWQVGKVNGHRLISHGGGIPGFSTEISRFVDDKLTVIVLTNLSGGDAGRLARGIAGRIDPELLKKPDEPIADPEPETTERLQGVIAGILKGEFDPELFTEGAVKALGPRITEDKGQHAQFGGLKSLKLLERTAAGEGARLRYRADFENVVLEAIFSLDKAGKIEGIGLRPGD